jgi:hypothetical protein
LTFRFGPLIQFLTIFTSFGTWLAWMSLAGRELAVADVIARGASTVKVRRAGLERQRNSANRAGGGVWSTWIEHSAPARARDQPPGQSNEKYFDRASGGGWPVEGERERVQAKDRYKPFRCG